MTRTAMHYIRLFISILFLFMLLPGAHAEDVTVTGTVSDPEGAPIMNARVSFFLNSREFRVATGTDGRYSVKVTGSYSDVAGEFQAGTPYPNPFDNSVNIPFIINIAGDLMLTVYNLAGEKVRVMVFPDVMPGSYNAVWDGCGQNNAPMSAGLYIYAITFKGRSYSGRLVKATGEASVTSGSGLEPVMLPPDVPLPGPTLRFPVTAEVTAQGYYPVRLTDITLAQDTVIDFVLTQKNSMPFTVAGNYIARYMDDGYESMILKGVNLGSSPPGYFPGEIAYAITAETYERWINRMGEAGFNTLRVYTLHPPVFYEKLAEYNQRHPERPLLLFQGIWLEEVEDGAKPLSYDLVRRRTAFSSEISEVIDCIHGNADIAFRYGKSYGIYRTDVSQWTAGYIIGREVAPQEIDSTNKFHPGNTSYSGTRFSLGSGTASEAFVAEMLDRVVVFEENEYSVSRPVSFSSWPTLDPLEHPTEIYTDEDVASFDITKILRNGGPGLFASYHAYPYYPNFISQQPSYLGFSDSEGPNSYLGYLTAMKNHYANMPLVIAEFGVPSSWGSAHQSYSSMHHGGYSEKQQGEKNMRMMNNMLDAGCAGGFMFAWMDEWFKRTWIVLYQEAYGVDAGGETIPTRQLWHNETSPEQCFGLLAFEQKNITGFVPYNTDQPSGPVSFVKANHDEGFMYLEINTAEDLVPTDEFMIAFDTYRGNTGESRFPNGAVTGNRAEFLLTFALEDDTALHHVTEAYDMNGLTVRFNLSEPVQQFKSTNTDGAPWKVMRWINDGFELTYQDIGKVPLEHASAFTEGDRAAVAWNGRKITVRLPWTMLYFYDPTQMTVNDGAVSYDGGYNFNIITTQSDGITVSVWHKGVVTNATTRYSWPKWLTVPPTVEREKASLHVIETGLATIPDFVE
ncbi:MAG: T9SS type A sorting domain-containing protein [Bacteroidota bacterium]|nr:T9SS type A sorting domain-containing protein [Bacteroidota bacterium]